MKEGAFKPTKNTFYKGRPMTGDTEVNRVYKDVYNGYRSTATIGGAITQGAYLATTEIASQPYYGEGNLSELYFRFTARNVSGSEIAIPKLSLFKMQDGIPVTPGEQQIDNALSLSGGTSQIVVFGSTMDMESPFLVEPFDGVNKGFEDNFFIESLTKRKTKDYVYIKAGDVYNFYKRQGVFAWDGASKSKFKKNVSSLAGTYSTEGVMTTRWNPDYGDWKSYVLEMSQLDNGDWRTSRSLLLSSYAGSVFNVGMFFEGGMTSYDEPHYPVDKWYEAGAYVIAGIAVGGDDYQTEVDAQAMGKITTKNSIFTSVGGSVQINSPKVASEEDTGNSEIVYMYSDVFFSEPEATDSSCLFSSLWENWVPAKTESLTTNPAGANPLGYSDNWSPFLQETFTSIDGIPSPSWCDMSNSNTKIGEMFPLYPNVVPEIELRIKISQLPPTARVNASASTVVSGTNGTPGNDDYAAYSLARSFNVFLSDRSYKQGRPLLRNMHKAYWPRKIGSGYSTEYGPGVGFHFIKTSITQEGYYCIPSCVGQGWKGADGGSSDIKKVVEFTQGWKTVTNSRTNIPIISGGTDRIAELNASGNLVEVPEDEWFTMRIKTPFLRRGVISYFPDLEDDQGRMPWLKCYEYTRRKLNDFADYVNNPTRCLMMGTFNLRPITSGGTNYHEVNMPYLKDDFIPDDETNLAFQDSQINVYVDDIKLLNYAPKTTNATKVPENAMGRAGLSIPTPHYNTTFDYLTGSLAKFSLSGNGTRFLSDNYFGEKVAPSAYTISIGFDTFKDISGAFVDKKSIALGDYFTATPNNISKIPFGYVTAGLSNVGNTTPGRVLGVPISLNNGYEMDPDVSGMAVSSSIGNNNYMAISGAGSIGQFQHKGLIYLSGSEADFNYASPARFSNLSSMENAFVRSKVMSVSEEGKIIKVNDVAPLMLPEDTDYYVFLDGMPFLNTGNRSMVKIVKREGTKIYLNKSIRGLYDTSGSGDYVNGWKRNNLERMWMSPVKYWIYLFVMNATNASGAQWGNWSQTIPVSSNTIGRPLMRFGNTLITSGAGSYGSTFNESTYYDGPYANAWNLNYDDPDSSLDLTIDYGFGSAEFSDEGALETLGGQMGDDFVYLGDNIISLNGYLEVGKAEPGDPFNFGMFTKPTGDYGTYTVKIHTSSGSDGQVPLLLSGYKDDLPTIRNLRALPVINTLSETFNMYDLKETDANNVLYTWEEGNADDILYRQLIVDTTGIQDKYHRTIDYWPLNESNDTVYGYHYSGNVTDKYLMSYQNIGTTDYGREPTIQGFCGWGSLFQNASSQGFYLSGAQAISGAAYLDEWTLMVHAKPGGEWDGVTWASGSQNGVNMYYHYGVMSLNLQGPRDNDSRPYVYFNAVPTDTDGAIAGPLGNSTVYLRSKTGIDWDGEQPLAMAVTFNKKLPRDNLKLYINGHLEDTSGTEWIQNTVVGASGTTMRKKPLLGLNMHGLLEEIILYEKEMYFPQNANSFILDSTYLPDISGANVPVTQDPENVYQSRLFLMDHHNIRGSSPRDVARSNTTEWKVTGL